MQSVRRSTFTVGYSERDVQQNEGIGRPSGWPVGVGIEFPAQVVLAIESRQRQIEVLKLVLVFVLSHLATDCLEVPGPRTDVRANRSDVTCRSEYLRPTRRSRPGMLRQSWHVSSTKHCR